MSIGGGMSWPSPRCWALFLLASTSVLASCAGWPERAPLQSPGPEITGVLMENHGRTAVYAAKLLVPATGRFISCGNIAPGGACTTGFPGERYSGESVELSWSQQGEIWSTGELELEPAEEVAASEEWLLRVIIVGPGSAGAALIPKP